jgi:hypothetical protein
VQPRLAPDGEDRRGYALDEFVALHSSHAVTATTSESGLSGHSCGSRVKPGPLAADEPLLGVERGRECAGARPAVAADAPRGVASRARSRRRLACSGVTRVKPSCSHFRSCAANGFLESSPGKHQRDASERKACEE